MLEIEREPLIKLLQSFSSDKICEVVIHTIFKKFGKERDVDKQIIDVGDNNELEQMSTEQDETN